MKMRKSTRTFMKFIALVVVVLMLIPIFLLWSSQLGHPFNVWEGDGDINLQEKGNNVKSFAAVAPVDPDVLSDTGNHIDYSKMPRRDWHDYKQIQADAQRHGPGEQGKPYILSPEEKQRERQDFSKHGFNKHISDVISIDRAIPDIRDPRCKTLKYFSKLPNASIIIPFHNEALTILQRTVHSILNRSPPELLHEIILVDDFSDHEECKTPLEDYMARHPKVRIIRATKREGLIRTRLLGASRARGQVLIFLDSHCECNVNWLPPLLERIALNRGCIACPMIDVIGNSDFHYETQAGDAMRGAFDWELYYKRIPINEAEQKRRGHPSEPFMSPIMAGGLFAVDRLYFSEIGGYDAGLEIWGGEQYDLSFKVWMCGGIMEDVPCSRVGHIYRKFSPYSFPSGPGSTNANLMRVVEVWMDEYKEYFYQRRPHLRGQKFGDISAQLELKKRLNCKSFKWYLTEIAPDILKYYPPVEPPPYAWGEVKNVGRDLCLDGAGGRDGSRVKVRRCKTDNTSPNSDQYFQMTWHVDLRPGRSKNCLDVAGSSPGTFITFYPCHGQKGNQHFVYYQDSGLMYHPVSNKCMDARQDGEDVAMSICNKQESTQQWHFKNYNATLLRDIQTYRLR
ncbi:polypeptide N-acetylgalactosaminyltransferase 10-like [Ptychodera flava]|uniref:polypeptide N-acetylgalactosaminyltransferase 10-like n=1 Tax=Ptychodera flava TaxID=63121 RepID=UPI003969EC78